MILQQQNCIRTLNYLIAHNAWNGYDSFSLIKDQPYAWNDSYSFCATHHPCACKPLIFIQSGHKSVRHGIACYQRRPNQTNFSDTLNKISKDMNLCICGVCLCAFPIYRRRAPNSMHSVYAHKSNKTSQASLGLLSYGSGLS